MVADRTRTRQAGAARASPGYAAPKPPPRCACWAERPPASRLARCIPPTPGDPLFERTADRLAAWCRARDIRRIAVTWDGEPHCDHEAAAALADAVARRITVRVYHYLVWGWTVADVAERVRRHRVVSIDTAAGKPQQRRAMACHRSQRGGRIVGAAENFRLPDRMLRLLDWFTTLLLEIPRAS